MIEKCQMIDGACQVQHCGGNSFSEVKLNHDLTYRVCVECGHCEQSIDPPLDFEAVFGFAQSTFFGPGAAIVENPISPLEIEVLRSRWKVFDKWMRSASNVLEVGPGTGTFAKLILHKGHSATIVEHSEVLAGRLRGVADLQVHHGEFESINLNSNLYDAFCSFHVIEHVPNPLAHLSSAFQCVRPGGYAFLATPNAASWEHRFPGRLSPNFDAAHLWVFSAESLTAVCEQAGWTVKRVMTPEYTSGWLRVISKLIRRIKREDELTTAGKYSVVANSKTTTLLKTIALITWPFRLFQSQVGCGNELFFVLEKPYEHFGGDEVDAG